MPNSAKVGKLIAACAGRVPRSCWIALVLLDCLFSLCWVAGTHIVISGGEYATISENYILPYDWGDAIGFVVCACVAGAIGAVILCAVVGCSERSRAKARPFDFGPLRLRPILGTSCLLFAAYLPYLLTYWPGLIFGDSLSSIGQIVGWYPYSNHHPLAYTFCLKAGFAIAHLMGLSNTTACALCSMAQMVLFSLGLGTLAQWAIRRSKCGIVWRVLVVALFALSPYVATYSIAMWKDPLFSVALALMCIMLFDYIATAGAIAKETKLWLPVFAVCLLFVAFFRSNGVFIVLLVALCFVAAAVVAKDARQVFAKCAGLLLSVAALALVVTGPVYAYAGVHQTEKVETLGVPLNQMARVVASGGGMSEDDASYMNELLPLEEYRDTYAPTCVDSMKWSDDFNASALSDDFWKYWFSMMLDNPMTYLEAWELQTVGYWSVNQEAVISNNANIMTGNPRFTETSEDLLMLDIKTDNLLGESARSVLTTQAIFVPASWVLWFALFLALCLFACGNGRFALALAPLLALSLSLLVASPIWYWGRYVAALQFALPCLIAMLFMLARSGLGGIER